VLQSPTRSDEQFDRNEQMLVAAIARLSQSADNEIALANWETEGGRLAAPKPRAQDTAYSGSGPERSRALAVDRELGGEA
jgi:hypothetical protein